MNYQLDIDSYYNYYRAWSHKVRRTSYVLVELIRTTIAQERRLEDSSVTRLIEQSTENVALSFIPVFRLRYRYQMNGSITIFGRWFM